jgi:RNA polymerase sigma factor (sigma-70 family)
MTDEQIVDRVRGGETRLFEELVLRYQDRVYGMALRLTRRSEDARDVAQEVFLSAFRGLEGFKGDAKFSTWLYRIAWNRSADWLRAGRRPDRRAGSLEQSAEPVDGRADPEADHLRAEERAGLRRALEGLEEHYRVVVELHHYQELPYEQISEVLGVPVKTVETRLYRARKLLRERMAAEARPGRPGTERPPWPRGVKG